MKKLNQFLAMAGIALALVFAGSKVMAQDGGEMDANARIQRRADSLRMSLAVTNDADWKVISQKLVKVIGLQAEVRMAGLANMLRGPAGPADGGRRGLAAIAPEPDAASVALSNALDGNAPIAEIKAAMARVREARRGKQAQLAKAQEDLKSVLSTRQEAVLLSDGLLE
jgi:hypothetical protein